MSVQRPPSGEENVVQEATPDENTAASLGQPAAAGADIDAALPIEVDREADSGYGESES